MNGCLRLILVVLLVCVGSCLPMSADDSALFGEQGAYVPCDEAPADLPAYDPDSLAIAGRDTGYVPPDTAAAALPASDDDGVALYGHGVGFVAKPCVEPACSTIVVFDAFGRVVAPSAPGSWGSSWTNTGNGGFLRSVDGSHGIIQTEDSRSSTGGVTQNPDTALPFAVDLDYEFFDIDVASYRPSLLVQFLFDGVVNVDGYVQIFPKEGTAGSGPEISTYSGSVFTLGGGFSSGHIRIEATTIGFTAIVNGSSITTQWRDHLNHIVTVVDPTPGMFEISLIQSSLIIGASPSTYRVAIDNITIGTGCVFQHDPYIYVQNKTVNHSGDASYRTIGDGLSWEHILNPTLGINSYAYRTRIAGSFVEFDTGAQLRQVWWYLPLDNTPDRLRVTFDPLIGVFGDTAGMTVDVGIFVVASEPAFGDTPTAIVSSGTTFDLSTLPAGIIWLQPWITLHTVGLTDANGTRLFWASDTFDPGDWPGGVPISMEPGHVSALIPNYAYEPFTIETWRSTP